YKLIGIIYYGNNHFTSRIISNSGDIWYHDGIETQSQCQYEGNIATCNPDIFYTTKHNRKYSVILYQKL
ncbi:hypothetical protein BC629DRAFT_1273008, partial [Irpex lacteus]